MRFVLVFAVICLLSGALETYDLKCDFVKPKWIHGKGNACQVKDLEIRARNVNISSVNSDANQKYRETKAIWIHNQTVFYLPLKLKKFFPNIEIIHITNSSLKGINKSDLKPFKKLRRLILRGNDLVNVSDDLFDFNAKIRKVDFSKNRKFVGSNILQRFPMNNKSVTNSTEIPSL